jgi:hypothetical protein
MALTDAAFRQAEARMQEHRRGPVALAARYDAATDRVRVELSTGIELGFAPAIIQGLDGATPAQLQDIELSPAGLGLHFPPLDADIYLPGLLEGTLGSRAWMARHLGATGGKARSSAKATAARENGKKGGRPRKAAAGK